MCCFYQTAGNIYIKVHESAWLKSTSLSQSLFLAGLHLLADAQWNVAALVLNSCLFSPKAMSHPTQNSLLGLKKTRLTFAPCFCRAEAWCTGAVWSNWTGESEEPRDTGGRRVPGTLPERTKQGKDVRNGSLLQGGCRKYYVYYRRMIIQAAQKTTGGFRAFSAVLSNRTWHWPWDLVLILTLT